MSRRMAGTVVLALWAALVLSGCATYPNGRPSAILPGAALGAAVGAAKGGLGGAATGAAIGGASGLALDFLGALGGGRGYYGDNSPAGRLIEEHCSTNYGNNTDAFVACVGGAYGHRQHYSGGSGGLYAGRVEFLRNAARDGEQFGRSLGKAGM